MGLYHASTMAWAWYLVTALWALQATAQTCSQYGSPSGSSCLCPPGFNPTGGNGSCALPVCGGSLYDPGQVAPGGTGGYGNVSLGSCACQQGWGGPSCTVCTSSSACSSSLSKYLNSSNSITSNSLNSTVTCSKDPVTYSSSQMACDVNAVLLTSLFPGQSILTITRTLNASLTPGGSSALTSSGLVGGDGVVYAQLWYQDEEEFYCQATGCTQATTAGSGSVNGSTWTCPTLNCTCPAGSNFCGAVGAPTYQNLTGSIDPLAGPLTIDCSGTDVGSCSFGSPFLNKLFGNNGLGLTGCTFGECVEQYVIDAAAGITEATTSSSSGLNGGVIAGLAVVGAILAAIVALLIWAFVVQRRARNTRVADGVVPKSGGVGVNWTGVSYEVKPTGRTLWDRIVTWSKGSGGLVPSAERGEGVGPGGGKMVLSDSCGSLPSGGFCCILGPSGAGKSTLVDILAGKRKSGRVTGEVGFANTSGRSNRVRIGFVDQADILSPTSTVLETLLFAARLRLPESVPEQIKTDRAQTVLQQLGLEQVAHTRVGSTEHRGISGGEMRRVSIGIELVAAPDVLVLDEPTSGLDSVSAARLVKLLKGLTESDNKTTIIASIHQPSSALYHAFNQVVLLADGKQLYFGPGGNRPAEYFAAQGRPCPAGYNIADHLLEIASSPTDGLPSGPAAVVNSSATSSAVQSSGSSETQEKSSGTSRNGSTEFHNESRFVEKGVDPKPLAAQPTLLKQDGVNGEPTTAAVVTSTDKGRDKWWPVNPSATTFLTQMEVLSGREWRNLRRDKTLLIAHLVISCVLGVFAGGLYFQVNLTIAGFQNRVGSLFFLGSLIAFSSLSALYNLVEVRGLFLRERAGSFYSPQAWLLTRVVFDVIPLRLIPTILVGIIVYFMVGLALEAARFFKYLLILVEYSLAMTLFNFLLACIFRQGGIAILLSSLCNLFLMTYAGFFVNIGQIPPVLRWLRYFSTLGYTLEALSVNEVGSGLMIIDVLEGVPIQINAEVIMETLFGFKLGDYYRDVLVLFAFIAGFAVLLVGTVVYFLRERR